METKKNNFEKNFYFKGKELEPMEKSDFIEMIVSKIKAWTPFTDKLGKSPSVSQVEKLKQILISSFFVSFTDIEDDGMGAQLHIDFSRDSYPSQLQSHYKLMYAWSVLTQNINKFSYDALFKSYMNKAGTGIHYNVSITLDILQNKYTLGFTSPMSINKDDFTKRGNESTIKFMGVL